MPDQDEKRPLGNAPDFALALGSLIGRTQIPPAFLTGIRALASNMQLVLPKIVPALSAVHGIGTALVEARRREALLAESGWLPHSALPLEELARYTEGGRVDALFDAHLRDNWASVRQGIQARIDDLNINQGSKEAVREALQAHEHQLYRCVCRTLMPEIERAVRIDLNGGSLQYPSVDKKKLTPIRILQTTAGERYLSETEPGGYYAVVLLRTLEEHIYERIDADQAKLAALEADPVPNRHATLHGLIDYNTHKSSMNAIFMTDYVLQVISATKT